ncbi:MAG: transcriptional regulator [Gemella sp.]|nr:transcriptional regulator [Gemella sp.]
MTINKLAGYRASAGIKTKTMAELLNVAPQTYLKKEKKQIIFKDNEKIKVLEFLKQYFPTVTLEELFF